MLRIHFDFARDWKRRVNSALLAVALGSGALVVSAPPAYADMFKPSRGEQIKLGDQATKQILKQYKRVDDKRARTVETVGQKLINQLSEKDRKAWDWEFYLLESKELNAFALPGGSVFILTGLMEKMKDNDELAAVMGHEIAHVYKQHYANMVADARKRELGVGILLGATGANSTAQTLAGITNSLLDLNYSRKDEEQADDAGLKLMYKAGYDPQGMLDLFAILQKAGGDGGTPEFLRSHPVTSSRINKTKDRIKKLK